MKLRIDKISLLNIKSLMKRFRKQKRMINDNSRLKENVDIEIVIQPIKKLVIFECTEFSIEEFFKKIGLVAMSGQPIALNWAEGIVFLNSPYRPDSDMIIEQMLKKGTMYWAGVIYASMPEYQSFKKFGAREIPIINQTSVPYLRQVARWLKKRP